MAIQAVFIDSREPKHIQALKFGGVPVAVTMLDFGDVWTTTSDGAMIAIERKTPSDLLGSIGDGRVFAQCAGIRAKTPWAYLVVSGPLLSDMQGKTIADGRSTGWEWASVQGALLQIQELGVGVVHSTHDHEFEQTVTRLARRTRSNEVVIAPKHESRAISHGEAILTSLPGIGLDRAQAVLDYFHGQVGEALAWLTWEGSISEVSGIGKGIKRSIRAALKLREDEELYCWGAEAFAYHEASQAPKTADQKIAALPVEANAVREEEGILLWG